MFVVLDPFSRDIRVVRQDLQTFLKRLVRAEHGVRSWGKAAVNKTDKVPGGEAHLNSTHVCNIRITCIDFLIIK